MTINILKSLARNHPEDTVSDVLCDLFNKDKDFSRKFLKSFIKKIDDYEIVSINRNFSLNSRLRPDITFVLRKKGRKKINYYHIETKIGAKENNYGQGRRTQFSQYTEHMKKNLKELQNKCVLLCPSYIECHNEEKCQRYVINDLINLLEECFKKKKNDLAILLIKYLKEECEITDFSEIDIKNFDFITSTKIDEYKKILSDIRTIMSDIYKAGNKCMKSGDWKKDQWSYYFAINLKKKYSKNSKWDKKDALLSYEFWDEADCKSPLKIYFHEELFGNYRIMNPHYNNNKRYYFHILEDPENVKLLSKYLRTDSSMKELIKYVKNVLNKKGVIEAGNKFLRTVLRFISLLDTILTEKKYTTEYASDFGKDKMIYKLRIRKPSNSKKYLDIVFDPIAEIDEDQMLRWESNMEFSNRKIAKEGNVFYCGLLKKHYKNINNAEKFVGDFFA